jgi:hypothetical protein
MLNATTTTTNVLTAARLAMLNAHWTAMTSTSNASKTVMTQQQLYKHQQQQTIQMIVRLLVTKNTSIASTAALPVIHCANQIVVDFIMNASQLVIQMKPPQTSQLKQQQKRQLLSPSKQQLNLSQLQLNLSKLQLNPSKQQLRK